VAVCWLLVDTNEQKLSGIHANAEFTQSFIRDKAKGVALQHLNHRFCRCPLPVPPLSEQREIVGRVETLFAYADRLEARYTVARAQVERLTPALLAKAFRGELVPQDPHDEPASVLERIRRRAAAPDKPKQARASVVPRNRRQRRLLMLSRKEIKDAHLTTILKDRGHHRRVTMVRLPTRHRRLLRPAQGRELAVVKRAARRFPNRTANLQAGRMRLDRLSIPNYCNLRSFAIDFDESQPTTVLLGATAQASRT
jgi:hypothetical protein